MATITKTECWDMLEDILLGLSESRTHKHDGVIKLIIALIVSSARDNDTNFILSDSFKKYCKQARLNPYFTRKLLMQSLNFLKTRTPAELKQRIKNGDR